MRHAVIASACALTLPLAACDRLTPTGSPRVQGRIVFVQAADTGAVAQQFPPLPAITGGFLSVMDSVHLVVTPEGGAPIVRGRRLRRGEATTLTLDGVTLPVGPARFDARVLSDSGVVLFAPSAPVAATVTESGYNVEIPVSPRAPVLVAVPDTFRYVPNAREQLVIVQNRGIDSVVWNALVNDSVASLTRCATECVTAIRTTGVVRARRADTLRLLHQFGQFGNQRPSVFRLRIGSREGSVVMILQPRTSTSTR